MFCGKDMPRLGGSVGYVPARAEGVAKYSAGVMPTMLERT